MHSSRCLRGPVLVVLSLAVFVVAPSVRAQPTDVPAPPAPAAPPSLAALVEQAAKRIPTSGYVAAEITPTSVSYASAGTFGLKGEVAPEKTLFEIGSITKVFTGLLLAHAVVEGKATLADPISKHLPTDMALRPAVAAITLEQLATHTSGLPRLPTNLKPANPFDPYADYTVEQLYAFLRDYDPAKPSPQPYSYSNLGFGLLGHLIGRMYDRSWAELVREKITGPLGMVDTVVELDADRQARFAAPYSGTQAVSPWHLPALSGAGALRSTAADMGRFAQALLTGKPETLQAAWALAREPRQATDDSQAGRIGLAIFVGGRGDAVRYEHGGGTGGFRTHLEIRPSAGRAVVVLANNDSADPAGIAVRLRPRAPAAPAAPAREEQPLAAEKLEEFPGVYAIEGSVSAIGGNRRFTFVIDEGGKLRAGLTGQSFLPVFFAGDDRFFARTVAAEFQFARDAAGKIVAVTLNQNGRQIRGERTSAPSPKVLFPPVEKLRDYAGRYQLAPTLLFEIEVRGSALSVKLTGQPALPVHNDAPDHFVYDVVEAALTFERGADGAVSGLILHQNGDHRAPRLPPLETK